MHILLIVPVGALVSLLTTVAVVLLLAFLKPVFPAKRKHLLKKKEFEIVRGTPAAHGGFVLQDTPLGAGASSVVYCATHVPSQVQYAVKIVNTECMDSEDLRRLRTELTLLASLDHPNIVRMYPQVFQSPDEVAVCLELATGGQVMEHCLQKQHYSEWTASEVILGVASVLQYLHSRGITHRDLKPENVLYKTPQTKEICVVDFGFASEERHMHEFLGTTPFMSPELILGTTPFMSPELLVGKENKASRVPSCLLDYGPEVDIWALGVMCFLMLTGNFPFHYQLGVPQSTAMPDFAAQVMYQEVRVPEEAALSEIAKDFLQKLLTKDAQQRPCIEDILKHPWLQTQHAAVAAGTMPSKTPLPRSISASALEVLANRQRSRQRWHKAGSILHTNSILRRLRKSQPQGHEDP